MSCVENDQLQIMGLIIQILVLHLPQKVRLKSHFWIHYTLKSNNHKVQKQIKNKYLVNLSTISVNHCQ